jgi:hypothetical protein
MTSEKQTTVIEINGVKLEVDLRTAKRVDTLRVGDRVKCLVKEYSNSWKTLPGVVTGFEPFQNLPSIVVAYLDTKYGDDSLKFKSYNAQTEDFEIVADTDHGAMEVQKADILAHFDRDIDKKKTEMTELERQRKFFLDHFGRYFEDGEA